MPDPHTLAIFALSTMGLLMLPGPTVMFVVARSLALGREAGFISVLGVETGALLHVVVGAAGVSAVIAASPVAFAVIRYAGAAYLVVLGCSALRRLGETEAPASVASSRWAMFRQGVIADALNPKTALFFIAFVPQFIDSSNGSVAGQFGVLGLCFVVLAAVADGLYVLMAVAVAARLRGSARGRRRVDGASACTYLALGVAAAAVG